MDFLRWSYLGMLLLVLFIGIAGFKKYQASEIKKALPGYWQAEFIVDHNLKNTRQVARVSLDLKDDGALTLNQEIVEEHIQLAKDSNGFDMLASHGTASTKTSYRGKYSIEKAGLRVRLGVAKRGMRTSFPFSFSNFGGDPDTGRPFIDLVAGFVMKDDHKLLVLSSSKEFPEVTLKKSGLPYMNDFILKTEEAIPDAGNEQKAIRQRKIPYEETPHVVSRVRTDLIGEPPLPEAPVAPAAPVYQPFEYPEEIIKIDLQECANVSSHDRLSVNGRMAVRVLDIALQDDMCHFKIYWSPPEGRSGAGSLRDCRFPRTNIIAKIFKLVGTGLDNLPVDSLQYELDLNRCDNVELDASETLVREMGLTRQDAGREPVYEPEKRTVDPAPPSGEDIKALSVKERLRRAKMEEERGLRR